MSATIERTDLGYVVSCAEHSWTYRVKTDAHATNLAAKHDREYEHAPTDGVRHPDSLDLSGAADYVLICLADRDDGPNPGHGAASYYAALDLWERLTGLTGETALDYARAIRETGQRAALIPF